VKAPYLSDGSLSRGIIDGIFTVQKRGAYYGIRLVKP
jgi:hypothetical protein